MEKNKTEMTKKNQDWLNGYQAGFEKGFEEGLKIGQSHKELDELSERMKSK